MAMNIRTVGDLRQRLDGLPEESPVRIEVSGRAVAGVVGIAEEDGAAPGCRVLVLTVTLGVTHPTPEETAAQMNAEMVDGPRPRAYVTAFGYGFGRNYSEAETDARCRRERGEDTTVYPARGTAA